jgi:hypothetical protein
MQSQFQFYWWSWKELVTKTWMWELCLQGHILSWALVEMLSSGAHYATQPKYFSHPSLLMYSFATPPIKLKLGQQIGGRLLIANHMDQSLWWANQKHWAAVRSYLLHCASYQPRSPAQLWWGKTIFVSQTGTGCIFFIHLYCAGSHTEQRWRCS